MRWTELIRRARRPRSAASSDVGQWVEAVLLVMLIVQVARLLWALATPVGLFGEWRAREPVVVGADARNALFAGFDPFFRSGAAVGPGNAPVQQVTSLPLKLYGIRVNEATGLGSAIIANEGGEQTSYAVGDEIAPGIKLKAVAFDHVVIERGGATETLYIDQSGGEVASNGAEPPSAGAVPPPGMPVPAAAPAGPLTSDSLRSAVSLLPRTENGRVTGIVTGAQSSPAAFAAVGFRPGDIIVQVNGQPVRSADAINDLQNAIRPGARISLMVERGAATVPINIILPESR